MGAPKDPEKREEWKDRISATNKGKQFRLGTHQSEETREKIGEANRDKIPWNKGKKGIFSAKTRSKISKATKGKNNPFYGKRHSQETKTKISEFFQGLQIREQNPNWKGGITPLAELIRKSFKYRQWRSDVFTRDDFTCQECGRRGVLLNSHHLESFAFIMEINDIQTYEQAMDCEELWNINNGITLCKMCHEETKKKSWIHKNNRGANFLKRKMNH